MKLPFVQNNIDMSFSPWSTSRSKLCLDDHTHTCVVNFAMKIIDRWWVFLYNNKNKTIILLFILLVLLWSTHVGIKDPKSSVSKVCMHEISHMTQSCWWNGYPHNYHTKKKKLLIVFEEIRKVIEAPHDYATIWLELLLSLWQKYRWIHFFSIYVLVDLCYFIQSLSFWPELLTIRS
jgi:hypothetical protein